MKIKQILIEVLNKSKKNEKSWGTLVPPSTLKPGDELFTYAGTDAVELIKAVPFSQYSLISQYDSAQTINDIVSGFDDDNVDKERDWLVAVKHVMNSDKAEVNYVFVYGYNGAYLSIRNNIHESYQPMVHKGLMDNIVKMVCSDLQMDPPNSITFLRDESYTKQHSSFGGYQPSTKDVIVVTYKRNLADSTRSLCHELYHHYQNVNNNLPSNAGADGDEFENAANAYAGSIMRKIGRKYPEIYEYE